MAENKDSRWGKLLIKYLHDPVDKPWKIQGHEDRAKGYANLLNISISKENYQGSDILASTIERNILPQNKVRQEFNEIRHPFSEGYIEVSSEFKEIEGITKKVFESLQEEGKNNIADKEKFLYLWRNLLPLLIKNTKNEEIKKIWGIIPADTRVPDHSLWEHLKVTTSISAMNYKPDEGKQQLLINNSLFLLSIGPVQSFISNARKLSDFWAGSFILSYLIFEGMKVIIDKYGPTSIIYPDLYEQPLMDKYLEDNKVNVENSFSNYFDMPTIPNRFVAILPIEDKKEIEELGNKIEKKIRESWMKIGIEIIKEKMEVTKIRSNNVEVDIKSGWKFVESQLKTFPEIYWVALPFKKESKTKVEYIEYNEIIDYIYGNQDTIQLKEQWNEYKKFLKDKSEYKSFSIGNYYSLLYTMLEKMMGARKNLRNFEQLKEKGKKCSMCGEYNGIIEKKNVKENNRWIIKEHEQLCAICAVKRGLRLADIITGEDEGKRSFPSIEEVCFADYREKVMGSEEWEEYVDKWLELGGEKKIMRKRLTVLPKISKKRGRFFPASLVYEHNLNKNFIKNEFDINVDNEKLNEIKKVYKKLKEKYGTPQSYYAIIKLDGDRMGKWLSGENMPSIETAYNSNVWNNKLSSEFKEILKDNIPSDRYKKMLSPALHSSISAALRNYAIEFVRKIVEEEHLGKLIYAGGDDVLALVNLKDLFSVMRKLRFAFSGQIKFNDKGEIEVDIGNTNGFVEKDSVLYLTMGKNATASMGVVIAHYKIPLRMVIKKVNEMEKEAKRNKGSLLDKDRNSFAIAWMKHSGETVEFVSKYNENNKDFILSLEKIKNFLNEDADLYVSKSFINKIIKFIYSIYDKEDKEEDENNYIDDGLFEKELVRIIRRSLIKNKKQTDEKVDEFVKNVKEEILKFSVYEVPEMLSVVKAFIRDRR